MRAQEKGTSIKKTAKKLDNSLIPYSLFLFYQFNMFETWISLFNSVCMKSSTYESILCSLSMLTV